MLSGWLLKTEEGNISYEELKMSAQDRSRIDGVNKEGLLASICSVLPYGRTLQIEAIAA